MFEPANPFAKWNQLVESYGTQDRPPRVEFTDQQILFGGLRGGVKPLGPAVSFDATIDEFGLWLRLKGAEGPDLTRTLRIPGTHVRPAGNRGGGYRFDLYAEPPVRIAVAGEFGDALMQKSRPGAS